MVWHEAGISQPLECRRPVQRVELKAVFGPEFPDVTMTGGERVKKPTWSAGEAAGQVDTPLPVSLRGGAGPKTLAGCHDRAQDGFRFSDDANAQRHFIGHTALSARKRRRKNVTFAPSKPTVGIKGVEEEKSIIDLAGHTRRDRHAHFAKPLELKFHVGGSDPHLGRTVRITNRLKVLKIKTSAPIVHVSRSGQGDFVHGVNEGEIADTGADLMRCGSLGC